MAREKSPQRTVLSGTLGTNSALICCLFREPGSKVGLYMIMSTLGCIMLCDCSCLHLNEVQTAVRGFAKLFYGNLLVGTNHMLGGPAFLFLLCLLLSFSVCGVYSQHLSLPG